jgi:hypothetical protein
VEYFLCCDCGAVAQLGERVVRNDEVVSSILISSTNANRELETTFQIPKKNMACFAKHKKMLSFLFATLLSFQTYTVCAATNGNQFTSIFGIAIADNITSNDIIKILGASPLFETGKAGEYEVRICYKSRNGFVEFLSGEMGCKKHHLLSLSIRKTILNNHCPSLPPAIFSVTKVTSHKRYKLTIFYFHGLGIGY